MKITDLLSIKTIDLKVKAKDKTDVLKQAVKLISASGNISDVVTYEAGVFNREKESTTGVGEGIAIPHCKSEAVSKPTLAAMIIPDGVEYASLDGEPVNVLFLIAAPVSKDNVHLDVLAKLSNLLMHPEFKEKLLKAETPEAFMKVIDEAESEGTKEETVSDDYPRILAVTACPTGIAHTYMAEESLIRTAKEMNMSIKVETNGQSGVKHQLTDDEIAHAEGIIIACDINVEMTRFNGHRVLQCPVAKAINKPKELIEKSLDKKLPIFNNGKTKTSSGETQVSGSNGSKFSFRTIYKHLMYGISHMVPVVVASGIILALSFFIDSCCGNAGKEGFGTINAFANILNQIGGFGLGTLMLPVIGGFIAYSIAGRAGLAAGFIGGMCASQGKFSILYIIIQNDPSQAELVDQLSKTAAGFLGAILAGFLAGYVVLFLQQKAFAKMPKALSGVKSIFLEPVCSVAITGLAMVLINVPVAYINIGISMGLSQMLDKNLIYILAFLVAALMATDMGGPINKASHYFCYYLLTTYGTDPTSPLHDFALIVNAAHVVGIMVPPMACALCVWLFPQKFKKADRLTAPADALTGFCGITEGAIPYVAKDPIRVIASCMIGAGVGGIISCWGGLGCVSAEGGIFAMAVGTGTISITLLWGLIGVIVGTAVAGLIMGLLKKDVKPEEAQLNKWKGIPTQPVYNGLSKVGHFFAKAFKKKKSTDNVDKQ